MSVQLAQGVLKSRESTASPWENIMVEVSPNNDTNTLASGFAPDYDSTHVYNTGDLCSHEGGFYKCKTDGVSGTWNSTRWDFIDVDTIKSNIEGIIGDGQLDASFTAADLTGAANELKDTVGSDPLETTAQDLSGGINELKNTLTQLKTNTFGNINLTGTNTTGATITAGTFFYNNDSLVRAMVDILDGASITIGTNVETITAGGLNSLNNELAKYRYLKTLGVGETWSSPNQFSFIGWLGWNGTEIHSVIAFPNAYIFPGSYSGSIKTAEDLIVQVLSTNASTNAKSKLQSISIGPSSGSIMLKFSSQIFSGVNNVLVGVCTGFNVTRIS